MSEQTKFEHWALVELMGHQRIVGRVTEQTIAGAAMLRVDVPDAKGGVAYTRFYGSSAIYAINPVGEKEARALAARMDQEPVYAYQLKQLAEGVLDESGEIAVDDSDDD